MSKNDMNKRLIDDQGVNPYQIVDQRKHEKDIENIQNEINIIGQAASLVGNGLDQDKRVCDDVEEHQDIADRKIKHLNIKTAQLAGNEKEEDRFKINENDGKVMRFIKKTLNSSDTCGIFIGCIVLTFLALIFIIWAFYF